MISQGSEGVRWFAPGRVLQAVPPRVQVASTVGAGDSLLAGMAHGLLTGLEPQDALRNATAIAAMAVTQIGFGIDDPARLAELANGVSVHVMTEQ